MSNRLRLLPPGNIKRPVFAVDVLRFWWSVKFDCPTSINWSCFVRTLIDSEMQLKYSSQSSTSTEFSDFTDPHLWTL